MALLFEEMILIFEQGNLPFLTRQSTDFLRVLMLPVLGMPACDHVILSKFWSASIFSVTKIRKWISHDHDMIVNSGMDLHS